MADYRQWATCKVCNKGQINGFGGKCNVCLGQKREAYIKSLMEEYDKNPRFAFEIVVAKLASIQIT